MKKSTCQLRASVPDSAFIDPSGKNLAQIRELAHAVVEIALSRRARAQETPPISPLPALPERRYFADKPVDEQLLLQDLEALVGASSNKNSPNYVAHMGAVSSTMSALGDFVASCINDNMIGLELSPTTSLLEEELCRQMAEYFGLGDQSGGVVTTGGSLSNLHALLVARNAMFDTLEKRIQASQAPVILASEASHASVEKSAMIMGLGSSGAIKVKTNSASQMDVNDLKSQYSAAVERGEHPFCLVATAGTTVTGNIDPLRELGAFAREQGLWFHVDAAWGGGLQFSPKLRDRLTGIADADSLTFCPQKLLLVSLSSSAVLFRDMGRMVQNFRIGFPYIQEEEGFINRSEIGVQGSRSAEIIKLWLTLQHVGVEGFGDLIERWVHLAERVADEVGKREFLTLVGPPQSGIVCFRGTPSWIDQEHWRPWNTKLHEQIVDQAEIYLSLVRYDGVDWLRAVFANPYTTEEIVSRVFAVVDAFAQQTQSTSSAARGH